MIETIFRFLDRTVDAVLAMLMAGTVVVVSAAVVFRYVLNNSLGWTEEISANALAWITFYGAYACFRHRSHLALDFLPEVLPPFWRRLTDFVTAAILCAFLAVLAWYSWKVMSVVGGRPIRTLDLPRGLFLSAMPIASVLMIFAIVRDLFRTET